MIFQGKIDGINLNYEDKKRISITFKGGGYAVIPIQDDEKYELGETITVELTIYAGDYANVLTKEQTTKQ